jgi:2-iminoacetate synthase ThiH
MNMADIIISFFAAIGAIFLIVEICDYFFYKSFQPDCFITINFIGKDEEEIIKTLEMIATVQKKKSGKAALGIPYFIVEETSGKKAEIIYHYLRVFAISGKVTNGIIAKNQKTDEKLKEENS